MSSTAKGGGRRSRRYPQEVKDRAVRLVLDHEQDYDSRYAAVCPVAAKLDIGAESLRVWVRNATGQSQQQQAGASVSELSAKNAELTKENRAHRNPRCRSGRKPPASSRRRAM